MAKGVGLQNRYSRVRIPSVSPKDIPLTSREIKPMKAKKSSTIPFVIEKDATGERSFDIYSRLLNDRIIFINSEIEEELAGSVCAQLLFLESDNDEEPISLYINSPGGYIDSGLAILDTMELIKPQVKTVCLGMCCSMAAVLLACGAPGKRYALPHSRVMIHQPSSGTYGKVTDMEIDLKESLKLKEMLNEILADKTGQNIEKIKNDVERDYWLSSQEAMDYGIVDKVINKKTKIHEEDEDE